MLLPEGLVDSDQLEVSERLRSSFVMMVDREEDRITPKWAIEKCECLVEMGNAYPV